ncbi:MAG: TetR/AcrR family transcriptional regulator [Bacteroidia bacterium]
MEQKQQILTEAATLFMKFGFKSITMDDIARELGLSKKTLYLHFNDKNDLVDQCVVNHLNNMQSCCVQLTKQHNSAIDQIIELTKALLENMKQVNQSAIYDLKKYFKTSWDKLENHRNEFIYQQVKTNIQLGKTEGIYYKDIDVETITVLYIHLVQILTDPDKFPANFTYHHMHKELVKYHLRSICNEKGLAILNQKIKEI